MAREHSKNHNNDLSTHLQLLQEAAVGRLENLECPSCKQATVSVWFSHPAADTYRTWFICAACDFHSRAQNTERPAFFSEDRVSTELEEHDLSILRQTIFKRPPQRLM
jgi:transposase-like protein